MKKQILFLSVTVFAVSVLTAQTSIPNGNFEQWTSTTYDIPQNYVQCSNTEAFYAGMPNNEIKSTDSHHGTYAVQLTTEISANHDTIFGYFFNINPNGSPSSWHGGMPYNQKPTGIRGYYKYNVASVDSGTIIVVFSKLGNNIGTYFFKVGGVHSTYTLFNFTFNPVLAVIPDSVAFGVLSCNFSGNNSPSGPAGSTLKIDSISFTGVTSQPILFNGDFENWQSQTLANPNSWYAQQGGGNQNGVTQTTDAYKGNYAVELKTFLGQNNNNAVAQSGQVSTGYYPQNCNSNCYQMGGYPFSNSIDTLAFWYKYAPSVVNDNAQVSLNFKQNGSSIWSTALNLSASATYKYEEIPFNIGPTPDTAIVSFQSSLWQDSALSYIGSDLKVDEAHFKSQPLNTGIFELSKAKNLMLFPNPCKGQFTLKIGDASAASIEKITISDLLGNLVDSRLYTTGSANSSEQFNTGNLPSGLYIIQVNTKDGIYRGKLNKIE